MPRLTRHVCRDSYSPGRSALGHAAVVIIAALCVGSTGLGLSHPAVEAAAILTNGSFENGFAGWTPAGHVDAVAADSTYVATDGSNAAAFNGNQSTPNGTLSQVFATVPGALYTLQFDVGAVSFLNKQTQRLQVTVQGGATLLSQTVSVAAPGHGTAYLAQGFTFAADSAVATLTFQDVSTSTLNIDLMLDNVRVTQGVPGLVNGSFESGLTGWTATGLMGVASGDSTHPGSDGIAAVVFTPDNTVFGNSAVLAQTFATVPGQRYGLTFDLGTVGALVDERIRVTVTGAGVPLDQTLVVGSPVTTPFYIPQHLEFVADSTSATLTFQDEESNYFNFDGLLDNVAIAPESAQAPLLTVQPQRKAVAVGASATFAATASGPGTLTYQWQFNGANIPSANGNTYTIAAADATKVGNYRVIVTNAVASISSSAAPLTVLPPAIVLNGSFEYGAAAWSFSNQFVDVSSKTAHGATDGTQMVHWFDSQQTSGGIVSQTIATTAGQAYVLTFDEGAESLLNANEQRMQVAVTGAGGAVLLSQNVSVFGPAGSPGYVYVPYSFTFTANGSAATLSFQDTSPTTLNIDLLLDRVQVAVQGGAPVITADPQSVAVVAGGTATFGVSASGTAPLSYQWRFGGVPISAAAAASYTIANAQAANAGSYDVVVTNGFGSVPSAPATLTVVSTGAFTNGSFENGLAGWSASGNVTVATADSSYAASDGTHLAAFNGGQSTPNGILSQAFATTPGQTYRLTFDAGAVSFINHDQQLILATVQGGASLLSQTVTVAPAGKGTTYVPASFTFVADSSLATLTFQDKSLKTANVDLLLDHVQVTAQGGAPTITASPQSISVTTGSTATFSVSASGTAPLTYQWRVGGVPIPSATAASYSIANAQPGNAGSYDVVVTNGLGSAPSAAATLTVVSVGAFTNGSFENGLVGWTASGNLDAVAADSSYTASDGTHLVAFNGGQSTPNGILSQAFATTPGQTYHLTFDAGAVSFLTHDQQAVLVTVQGGALLLSQTVTVAPLGKGTTYVSSSFTFVADGTLATLTFQDKSLKTLNVDLLLDHVQIVPGP